MVSVVPLDTLAISWISPDLDGCLPILYYVVNKDGVDLPDQVSPSLTTFTDDISSGGGNTGNQITYMIKAVNIAGASEYS
jgi:hypothetical protein